MVEYLIVLGVLPALVAASGGVAPAEATGGERDVSLVAVSNWSCLFGGRPAELRLAAKSEAGFRGAAGWSLAVSGATVARGETPVEARPGLAEQIVVPLEVPAVRQGAVVAADLRVALYTPKGRTVVAGLDKRLWIFGEDPFAGRSEWLAGLRIRLFDPAGKTRDVLEQAAVPFSQTANVDSLARGQGGLLLIGEGVSLQEYRGLAGTMVAAAARGAAVLCLAPAEGHLVLPGSRDAQSPDPDRLTLRRASVIRSLDKRLDADGWPPDGSLASRGLILASERGQVVARVVDDEAGWPWLEARFPVRRGSLVVCLFDVVEKWDAGPAPRYLLARLFEHLDGPNEEESPAQE